MPTLSPITITNAADGGGDVTFASDTNFNGAPNDAVATASLGFVGQTAVITGTLAIDAPLAAIGSQVATGATLFVRWRGAATPHTAVVNLSGQQVTGSATIPATTLTTSSYSATAALTTLFGSPSAWKTAATDLTFQAICTFGDSDNIEVDAAWIVFNVQSTGGGALGGGQLVGFGGL